MQLMLPAAYSHSMVLGGLLVMSYTTRFTLRTCKQKTQEETAADMVSTQRLATP
jgi:hypothetical protein